MFYAIINYGPTAVEAAEPFAILGPYDSYEKADEWGKNFFDYAVSLDESVEFEMFWTVLDTGQAINNMHDIRMWLEQEMIW